MKTIDIVRAYLEANGFDGLVHGDTECGCHLGDFHICGEDFSQCKPAYKQDLEPGDDRGDWWMTTTKVPNEGSEISPTTGSAN